MLGGITIGLKTLSAAYTNPVENLKNDYRELLEKDQFNSRLN